MVFIVCYYFYYRYFWECIYYTQQSHGNHKSRYNLQLTEARRQGEILAADFFEKINLCVTFYIARASIYQNSEMMVWLWYSVVYNLSLYLCRYSSGATILYPIN